MAVIQRTLGTDLNKRSFDFAFELTVGHGHSGVIAVIPYPCIVNAIQIISTHQNQTPDLLLQVGRFIPGAGYTVMDFGTTFTVPVLGVSGVLPNGISLPSNPEQLKLMPYDVMMYVAHSSPTSGIFEGLSGSIIVTPVQDRITYFGSLA